MPGKPICELLIYVNGEREIKRGLKESDRRESEKERIWREKDCGKWD